MAVSVQCEHCGSTLEVGDELVGQQVKCRCGQFVQVQESASVMDLLSEELDVKANPLLAETPAEWAKATGAPPEIASQIEKRMAKKLSSNAGFMMAVTGAIIAIMLIIGLVAFLMQRKKPAAEEAWVRPTLTMNCAIPAGEGPCRDTVS